EIGVHVLDFGGGALRPLAGLPHVGTVADRQEVDLVRRTVAELVTALGRRERLFREAGVTSVEAFRARRAAGEFADEPATDLLLVVDGYLTLRTEFDDLEARLLPLAAQGLSYGLHLAVSATRWSELRPALKDLLGARLELRLGEPAESEVDGRRAEACHGPGFAPVRLLPSRIEVADLPPGGTGIPLGVDEDRLARVELDPAAEPHLVCFADAESGKTTLLRLVARGIVDRCTPEQARVIVVDPRRGLLGDVPDTHLIGYASTAEQAGTAARTLAESLRKRLPGP